MSFQYIAHSDLGNSIAVVTLKRSEKRNALNLEMIDELTHAFETLGNQPYRTIILTAEGNTFCSGLDLQQATDPALHEKVPQHMAKLFTAIYLCPTVTIAAVQGDALAGGGGLMAACDYAIMSKTAKIGFPETRRGLVAAQVAALLCRQMRMRDVRELLLWGELVDSDTAVRIGLVNAAVERDNVFDAAHKRAEAILKCGPIATKETKQLLDTLYPASISDDLEFALSVHRTIRQHSEVEEGLKAFLEKRPPNWSSIK